MLICATVPLALTLIGCKGDDGPASTGDDDETGITSLTTGDGDGDDPGDGDGDPETGDGDGDGDGEGDGDGAPDCGMVSIAPEYVPPNVMLVVDASGSMISNQWDHDLDAQTPNETRWRTLYGVVESIMNQFGPAMNAGIKRFPSETACDPNPCYNETACVVTADPEVGVGLDNGAAIPGPDDNGSSVEGGTPSTLGINAAVEHLSAQSPDIPRYILFITDGAANCTPGFNFPEVVENYDETLEPTVAAALADNNITTFVVGIDIINMLIGAGPDGSPEANPYERLNDVALAGGAPKNMGNDPEKFFNATNQDELLTALSGIITEITDCVIDLSSTEQGAPPPNQIPFVTFEADGDLVPFVEDCENEDGWAWLEYGVVVTFCGSYCDDFKGGGVVFDGTYGCPPAG
ncbi:MAG TPA: vWA domain-containing protein [Enhygromyxa sp.]|nr:vWA domain-containing protein [Enhygromyxa sp.]